MNRPTWRMSQIALLESLATDGMVVEPITAIPVAEDDYLFHVPLTYQAVDTVDLDLTLGANPFMEVWLGAEDAVEVQVDWHYDLWFQIQGNNFSFVRNADDLTLAVTALAEGAFTAVGRVGFLTAELTPLEVVGSFDYVVGITEGSGGTITVEPQFHQTAGDDHVKMEIDARSFPTFLDFPLSFQPDVFNLGITAEADVRYWSDARSRQREFNGRVHQRGVRLRHVLRRLCRAYADRRTPILGTDPVDSRFSQ